MHYINKATLMGTVVNELSHKVLDNGKSLVILRLLTKTSYKDKNKNKITDSQIHRVKIYGVTGDYALQTINKGDLIHIEGQLEYFEYPDGRTVAEIRCRELTPLLGHNVVDVRDV